MDIDKLVPTNSKFLTKDDVGEAGKNLTISRFDQTEIKTDDGNEVKAVIHWREDFKPLVLNKENATRLKMIFQTSDTDRMLGGVVNVYNDVFVQFAGKQTGGVRIRPPGHAQAQQQMQQQQPQGYAQAHAQLHQPSQDWQPTPPVDAYRDEPNW